jgi:glutamate-1-semialdehyde 2,1-aminomutase
MTEQQRLNNEQPSAIDREYVNRFPNSKDLFERHLKVTPGGITHLARALAPFPLFIERNEKSHKWDADGHEYIDYWLGHGAMLLGHAHPIVVEAVKEQAAKGFHAGGESRLGLEWAELVQSMVPSAERVRFVASGGEATAMAMRVARAHTGKDKILKFAGSFHGWHDSACMGVVPPYDVPYSPGVPKGMQESVIVGPFNDLAATADIIAQNNDIGAVILEPGGCQDDTIPSDPEFLRGLRELTAKRGIILIFDEVVTGFRYARGGAQEFFNVTPDLTALGKALGGGLPCGAVVGKADVMDVLAWRMDPEWIRYRMIPHTGTWNSNPGVAAAAIATLKLIRDTDATERAARTTRELVDGCNKVFERLGVDAFAYTRSSSFKIRRGKRPRIISGDFSNFKADGEQLIAGWGAAGPLIRKAMILEGVDFLRTDGYVSAAHTKDDVDKTLGGLERAIARLQNEGAL